MDFGFTEEQTMLGESLARTLERGADDSALFDLGAGAALMTEEAGGFGGSGADILMVFRTLGRAGAVTPLLDSVVLGAGILADAGEADLAEAAASGAARIAVALDEPGQRYDGTVATRAEGDRLTGEKSVVPGAEDATHLIVRATDGLWLVETGAEGLAMRGYALMDGGRAAEVTLKDTAARRIGDVSLLEQPLAAAILAVCADALGVMEKAVELTTDYLKTRKQFGVTLNKFQALNFRAADMYVSLELARSIALWASVVQLSDGDVVTAADRARLTTSRTGRHIGKDAIQLHGGIGVTAEYKVGHYTSRLTAIDHLLGDGDFAADRLAAKVGSYPTVDPIGAPYA